MLILQRPVKNTQLTVNSQCQTGTFTTITSAKKIETPILKPVYEVVKEQPVTQCDHLTRVS